MHLECLRTAPATDCFMPSSGLPTNDGVELKIKRLLLIYFLPAFGWRRLSETRRRRTKVAGGEHQRRRRTLAPVGDQRGQKGNTNSGGGEQLRQLRSLWLDIIDNIQLQTKSLSYFKLSLLQAT